MSKDEMRMNLERFAAIVEAYGGTPARWPEVERAAAVAFMKTTPEAQRRAEEAEALDSLLDVPETAPATRELQDRILNAMPARAAPIAPARGFDWSKLIPAAAVTCSLALGVVTGTQLPRLVGLDDETLALDAIASALTASASDAEMFGGSE
jgi:hypothetical protein